MPRRVRELVLEIQVSDPVQVEREDAPVERPVENLVFADGGARGRRTRQGEFPQQFAVKLVETEEFAPGRNKREVAVGDSRLAWGVLAAELCRPEPATRFAGERRDSSVACLEDRHVLVKVDMFDHVSRGIESRLAPPHADEPVPSQHGMRW